MTKEQKEKFNDLLENISEIENCDYVAFKTAIGRAKMLARSFLNIPEDYLTDLGKIKYKPSYGAFTNGSPLHEKLKRDSFSNAKAELKGIVSNVMEEVEISTQSSIEENTVIDNYVDISVIKKLKLLRHPKFKLDKLVLFCEELNSNYQNRNYLSVSILVRSIMNHIPPIFECKNFKELANNYAKNSIKKNFQNLQNSLKHIGDNHAHSQIAKSNLIPTHIQVNFQADLDVLLNEILVVLEK